MSWVATNFLLVPELDWGPDVYDEEYSHLPSGFVLVGDERWRALAMV